MFVDFFMVDLIFESDEVQKVIPLALFFEVVDVVIDEVCVISLEEGKSFPFVVYYPPNMLLLLLYTLQQLDLVVQLLNRWKTALIHL